MEELAVAVAAVPTALAAVIVYFTAPTMYVAPAGVSRAGVFAATIEYLALLPGREPANYVGRCKRCRKGASVVDAVRGTSRLRDEHRHVDLVIADAAGRVFVAVDNGSNACAYYTSCTCGAWVVVHRVEGRVSEHACNGKCMASTGPSCECACGGKNHGRSHA